MQGMERRISAFLDAQAADQGAARNTLLAYGRDLRDFAGWLARQGLDFDRVDRTGIEAYLVFCEAEGLSKATRARRLSAIRQLFRLAHDEGWRDDDPAIRLSGPTPDRHLPRTLSLDEVERLLSAAGAQGRGPGERCRNRALVELLYATGLRVSELVTLPVSAARGDPRMILVRGKGGRERLVPVSAPARAALADWLALRDAEDAGLRKAGKAVPRWLFPGGGAAGHLTRQHIHLLLKDISVRAGIDPTRVTPHALRHAFATHLLAGGADLRAIQTLLGHADVATTEIYTHVLDEHLKSLVLDHHPLSRPAAPERP